MGNDLSQKHKFIGSEHVSLQDYWASWVMKRCRTLSTFPCWPLLGFTKDFPPLADITWHCFSHVALNNSWVPQIKVKVVLTNFCDTDRGWFLEEIITTVICFFILNLIWKKNHAIVESLHLFKGLKITSLPSIPYTNVSLFWREIRLRRKTTEIHDLGQ